jgi:hypothetical protein
MKVNIENCVRQLGSRDGQDKARRFVIMEMIGNLRELRDRAIEGDAAQALREFFGLYGFCDAVEFRIPDNDEADAPERGAE